MEKENRKILCVEQYQNKSATIELIEKDDSVEIEFSLEKLMLRKEGDNFFETLIDLRKDLEKRDIKLLCKGCCKNVYPSGMLLGMGAGRKAYTLIHGEQAKKSSIVDIFDSCSLEEYGTIEQQVNFFEDWINSLGRWRYGNIFL